MVKINLSYVATTPLAITEINEELWLRLEVAAEWEEHHIYNITQNEYFSNCCTEVKVEFECV